MLDETPILRSWYPSALYVAAIRLTSFASPTFLSKMRITADTVTQVSNKTIPSNDHTYGPRANPASIHSAARKPLSRSPGVSPEPRRSSTTRLAMHIPNA